MSDDNDLAEKIAQARTRLPLPKLMEQDGLGARAKKCARCPFHDDEHPSFSVFQNNEGRWFWKCQAGCGAGDEIEFLCRRRGLSKTEAISLYLEMAGFPANRSAAESRKCPASHAPPAPLASPSPASLMSEGQTLVEKLSQLAARNACRARCAEHFSGKRALPREGHKLLRDLRGLEQHQIGRTLTNEEVEFVAGEWYRESERFLDRTKAVEDYKDLFLGGIDKVNRPTGETLEQLKAFAKHLPTDLLVHIPTLPNASERDRRVATFHREADSVLADDRGVYFLSCRDVADVCEGMTHQQAWAVMRKLASPRVGVIEIVSNGKPGPHGKSAEFRYLLQETENDNENDRGLDAF